MSVKWSLAIRTPVCNCYAKLDTLCLPTAVLIPNTSSEGSYTHRTIYME